MTATLAAAHPTQITEARAWLTDCGRVAVEQWSDTLVARVVAREYDGGWDAFLADTASLVPEDAERDACWHDRDGWACPSDRYVPRQVRFTHTSHDGHSDEYEGVYLVCPGMRVATHHARYAGALPSLAPVQGPEDSPILRSLQVPRGYVPPTTNVEGLTHEAIAAAEDHGNIAGLAQNLISLGGFGPDDRAYLLGCGRMIDDTWTSDYWTAHIWTIAARLVVGQE